MDVKMVHSCIYSQNLVFKKREILTVRKTSKEPDHYGP